MKKALLILVSIIVAIILTVTFSSKEVEVKTEVIPTLHEVTIVINDEDIQVREIKKQDEDPDLNLETEEVITSSLITKLSEVTEVEEQQQKPSIPIWNRDNSNINADELSLVRDSINTLIYDINLAIEMGGNYQPSGGRNLLAGDMAVTDQICGFTNNSFDIDHEFKTISAQHYCFEVLRNLMSSSNEYRDSKKTLKKIEQEMLIIYNSNKSS
ncbi:hypothetical protein CW745_12405 [Psychromonas sp. psych-6C06]|uniref:hypothetical protein n=1 Tax=Psychromonas sp. psych-6C06 TaxID=2058089 RepID=UPI000C34ACA7|nr:hypothetical protein [Psychromonas sp. psych-6C06]PKF61102.1 hypothetical protein CW745_12405 [Psychromonas sp. psych-6C06]